jgi:RNA polymerase sigma-70 factor (ECF subfamily)
VSPSATVEAPRPVPSDRELVRLVARARDGDGAAFGAVLRHYDPRLRALAFRLLGDPALTDDVLQEAYVKAYRALPRFRGEADLGTWLYRIAYNACLDELRRDRHGDLPLEAADRAAAPGADPGERAGEAAALSDALAALPAQDRAAVLLVDRDGLSYGRAGAVLGVPAGTVASRLNRARAALRTALEERP